jgi:chemotaxis protein MotA
VDIATIIGLILALGLILLSIGGSIGAFINLPSVMIVVGGTIGAMLVFFPLKDILALGSVVKKTIFAKDRSADEYLAKMVELCQLARQNGILALDEVSNTLSDEFLRKGLQMAVDGMDPEMLSQQMETEIEKLEERHKTGANILTAGATLAPAMGLIGTLIGLVQMLQNMSDPSSIGPAMAVALLTTFYGSIMANVFFTPMAGKLKIRSEKELLFNEVILSGVVSISKGENPRILESRILAMLPPKLRVSSFDKD